MVLAIHETNGPEWPKWRWWIARIAAASVIFAGVWWLVSQDMTETLVAAGLPWAMAFGCLAITLLWAVVTVPLMRLMGRWGGRKEDGRDKEAANHTSEGIRRPADGSPKPSM
jgi:peptidoglycan biosynthesis protein MviN/MurJ (putative lipid II flippase)